MERTGDLVALDLTVGQIATHVPAVGVQDIDLAVLAAEDHQLAAEGIDRVRFSIAQITGQSEAMPASRIPCRRGLRLDLTDLFGAVVP